MWGNLECLQIWQDGTWRILKLGRSRAREERPWGEVAKNLERIQDREIGNTQKWSLPPCKFPQALQCCLTIFPVHFTLREDCSLIGPRSSSTRKCIGCKGNPHLVPCHLFFLGSSPNSVTCQVPLRPYAAQRCACLLLQTVIYIFQDRIKQDSLTPQCPDLQLLREKPIWLICLHKKENNQEQPKVPTHWELLEEQIKEMSL